MGFPLELAIRYMASKKQSFISMGTFFAILGVALGVAGLATAMSVTGGFRKEFRDKVLGVNAHVLILKRSSYFGEYRDVMADMEREPGIIGIAPFTINPMMLTHGDRTATGVLLKGIDPALVGDVLDLPRDVVAGSKELEGLRLPGTVPPQSAYKSGAPQTKQSEPEGPGGIPRPSFLDQISDLVAEEAVGMGGAAAQSASDEALSLEPELSPEIAAELAGDPLPDDPASDLEGDEESEVWAELPEDAPMGSIKPEGGYDSVLPDDDILPDELLPDPCAGDASELPGIAIGQTLSENLRAGVGDCIQVTSPTIGFSFSGDSIRAPVAKQFRVVAVFYAGFDQYDAKLAYVDLYQAQQFHNSGDSVTGIEMRVEDIDEARNIAQSIEEKLGDGLLYTMDWEELNHGLFTALRIQQILMSLVLGLIIVVAAFTVIATLIMVVFDKKKEIAVMKAMGATHNAILRAFLYQGAIIGILGASLGLAIGIGVCKGLLQWAIPLDPKVYFISHLPVDIQPLDFMAVGMFAVLVCLVATVWPALHAAHLRPAEAFREQS